MSNTSTTSYVSANNAWSTACEEDGDVHIVWYENTGGVNWEVYYRNLSEAGWSDPERLTDTGGASSRPSLAVRNDSVHVVWDEGGGIYYGRFDGSAWSSPIEVTADTSGASRPSLALGVGGRLHLVWLDNRDGGKEIYYKLFDGMSWGADERLTTGATLAGYPCVAADQSGRVHVVWDDERGGTKQVYYKRFDGISWNADEHLGSDTTYAAVPTVAVASDGSVHVIWIDLRDGDWELYHQVHDGISWGGDSRITFVPSFSWSPSMAIDDDDNIHVTWHDNRDGNTEIYYKRHNGSTWGADQRLTIDGGTSKNPSLAAAPNGDLHVIWYDNRDGNYEVYWKWNILGSPPKPEVVSVDPFGWPADEGVCITDLAGTGFLRLAEVRLQKAGESDLVASNVIVESSTKMTCDISLSGAAEGYWDVVVENPDGQMDTLVSGFLVVPGPWTSDTRLTVDSSDSHTSKPNARCVATDGTGNIHVVWHDGRHGNNEIYYKKHDGMAWSADERLTDSPGKAEYPSIAVGGSGDLHVVWADSRNVMTWEIYYKTFDGIAWSADERLTMGGQEALYPSVAAGSGGNLYVVWLFIPGASDSEIRFMVHDGLGWGSEETVSTSSADYGPPAVAVDGSDNVHVCWYEQISGTDDNLRYKKYDGIAWGGGQILTTAPGIGSPSIAADAGGEVHVAWYDDRFYNSGAEVLYKHFDGVAWGDDERLTHSAGISLEASVAVGDDGIVFATWADERDGNFEVYFRRFDGSNWETDVRLTNAPDASGSPSTAVDGEGRLHLVWWDARNGNSEIYYKLRDPAVVSGIPAGKPEHSMPKVLSIAPNPARQAADIRFALASRAVSGLGIYDIAGRLVWESAPVIRAPGHHIVTWNGTDRLGSPVASGIYFLRLHAGPMTASAKILILK
jgi:hypothetical protein